MINIALAITAGIITIITIAIAVARETKRAKIAEIKRKKSISEFLDMLDDTRETRYSTDRSRLIRQLDGFRSEWNAYQSEYAVNFSMD